MKRKSDEETGEEEDEVPPMASPEHLTLLPSPYTSLIPGSLPAMRLQQAALQIAAQVAKKEGKELKKLPRPAYWTIITGMVIISTLVIALDGEHMIDDCFGDAIASLVTSHLSLESDAKFWYPA